MAAGYLSIVTLKTKIFKDQISVSKMTYSRFFFFFF